MRDGVGVTERRSGKVRRVKEDGVHETYMRGVRRSGPIVGCVESLVPS